MDVFHPEPLDLLRELHGDDWLQGVVIDTSRGATPDANFAIVRVEGLRSPVIVAVNHITEAV